MAGRVGILRTECRSECIDITEGLCKCLCVELSAYRQACVFVEEILAVIDASIFQFRRILKIHCRYLEHLSCTLTVASGDQRSVHIHESSLLEELVNRVGCKRTYAEHCLERICSWAQMCHCSYKFQCVALLLKRVVRSGSSFYRNLFCLNLKRLLCLRRRNESSLYYDGCPYV